MNIRAHTVKYHYIPIIKNTGAHQGRWRFLFVRNGGCHNTLTRELLMLPCDDGVGGINFPLHHFEGDMHLGSGIIKILLWVSMCALDAGRGVLQKFGLSW